MGNEGSVEKERMQLEELQEREGTAFPGSDYRPAGPGQHKEWMSHMDLAKVRVKDVLWPGTHNSATNGIGIPVITRPFSECQTISVYEQLNMGVRLFDIRVEGRGRICHGVITGYKVDVVINDVKRFIAETTKEIVIIEVRTEFEKTDPADFNNFLIAQFGDLLVPQSTKVFDSSLQDLLPHRVICIWKPRNSPAPSPGSPLFSSGYLDDDWIDTNMPATKFNSNLDKLGIQHPNSVRKFFYRVENTLTPKFGDGEAQIKPVTNRIKVFARLFVSQAHKKSILDRLQVFSTDFVDEDFINICVGVTMARLSA